MAVLVAEELEALEADLLATEEFDDDQLGGDGVTRWLEQMLARVAGLAGDGGGAEDPARIDRIALLERIRSAAAAAQATEMVQFARSQVAAQQSAGVDYRRLGRGIADQIALACRVSPSEGSRRLSTARDLRLDLPSTLAMLARGDINDYTAQLIAGELRPLSQPLRHQVDSDLQAAGVAGMAPRQAGLTARRLAYQADPEAARRRSRTARADRRVTLRPAPDTMAMLDGLLPVEQGVACFASLTSHTDRLIAGGDQRSRGQIMADALVERLTGQSAASATPVEVQIVMPVEALLDHDSTVPADLPGYGPLPADLVQELLDLAGRASWWRRVFTAPHHDGGRSVVDIDRRRRRFPGRSPRRFSRHTARLIHARDRRCRDPYCTAPIRHLDHILRHTDGGPSTVGNGRGVCERGNYVREMPGWSITLCDHDPHTTLTTTPTGHTYRSQAPNPP